MSLPRRTICYYAYFEKDASYKNNLKFFLKNGINDAMDYVFIVNGKSSVIFPKRSNIEVLFRENKGYDFGAYHYALNHSEHDWREYDYFIFLNTSVRGPYTQRFKGYNAWQDVFTSQLDDSTKLAGTTINAWPVTIYKPHVQGQMFAIDKECLTMLLQDTDVFSEADRAYWDVVNISEIGMSKAVLDNGWNITCLASKYKGIDYRYISRDVNPTSNQGDPNFVGAYWGNTVDGLDIMFIKTNRELPMPTVESFMSDFVSECAMQGSAWVFLLYWALIVYCCYNPVPLYVLASACVSLIAASFYVYASRLS